MSEATGLLNQQRARLLLACIILAYAIIAGLYAVLTPAWQAPDEPAHYNYIRHLAKTGRLPILQPGDYDQEYLETIKARRFPADMSIDPIRYESHQPPLYYLLAAPIHRLTGGALIPLRALNVLLGMGLLLITFRLLHELLPRRLDLALGGTAFVAFLPQHVAMSAAVNNDTLGELILASVVLLALIYLRGDDPERDARRLLSMSLLMGLGFLTKTTAYLALPLILLAILLRERRHTEALGKHLALGLIPGVLLGLPWWVRNWIVYGAGDPLGLRRHDAVVVGQPRTSEWIAQMGLGGLLRQAGATTFRSFWGQFGWMGVLMDSRIYLALGILSAIVAIGCIWALWKGVRSAEDATRLPRAGLVLIFVWLLLTVLSYIWYNLTFVQHQGRYLFPALPAWGFCFALGLDQALRPRVSGWLAGLLLLATVIYVGIGVIRGRISKWTIALSGGAGIGLAANALLLWRWRGIILGLIYIGLGLLDLLALFGFILPQLQP